jgi:hypothetical protein
MVNLNPFDSFVEFDKDAPYHRSYLSLCLMLSTLIFHLFDFPQVERRHTEPITSTMPPLLSLTTRLSSLDL